MEKERSCCDCSIKYVSRYSRCTLCLNARLRKKYAAQIIVEKTCKCGSKLMCNKGKSPICKLCNNEYAKFRYHNNINGARDKHRAIPSHVKRDQKLRREYSITSEYYDALLFSQGNKCAICLKVLQKPKPIKGQSPEIAVIDHDHDTGKVRGILCSKCNIALGGFCDNADLLSRAERYLNFETLLRKVV